MEDNISWRWGSGNEYSAKSFYDLVVAGGKTRWKFDYTWQLRLPPTVRIFCFLCLKGKILTHDVMLRRGMQCDLECVMCQSCHLETALHLLFHCEYATNFWMWYSGILGYSIMHISNSVQRTVSKSWSACKGRVARKEWGVFFYSGVWMIWKERNNKIFEGKNLDARGAAYKAWNESLLWIQNC